MTPLTAMSINLPAISKISAPVNAILALVIGYVLAQLTLDSLPRAAPTSRAAGVAVGAQKTGLTPQEMARDIAGAHLFGRASSGPVVKPEPTQQNAPDTKLNLTLHGVLAYDPLKSSLAIISSGGNREVVYAIGEKIVGNTTLQAVHPDRVIIRRSGKDETLRLPENIASLGVVRTAGNQSGQSGRNLQGLPRQAKELRDRLVREPSMMADLVTMRPYKRNGQLVGFRIQPKRDPELLASFGVQPGDVITSVNGIALTSNRQGITALGNLRKATSVDLIILRGGAEIPVSISLE